MTELTSEPFGSLPSGEPVSLYRFRNNKGVEVAITSFGGRIVSIIVPDRQGRTVDIALGFENVDGYLAKNPYFGALVGRYANRIANARFRLDGHEYSLDANDPPNTLHGGKRGFDSVLWKAEQIEGHDGPILQLRHESPDGDEGFPGALDVEVRYSLSDSNELRIEFSATTDKKTVLNLTNHSYFQLAGHSAGSVLDHVVTINADHFTPVDRNLIPTGELRSVAGTPFDFLQPKRIGEQIDASDEQLKLAIGYDHNFVLNKNGNSSGPTFAARAVDPASGRMLEVFTTQPGVQFYTGNHLHGNVKGKGTVYNFRTGFCLETQHFPDSPNHPEFPSTELVPGDTWKSVTIFRFSVSP
jgi:aldose 1-epimerase